MKKFILHIINPIYISSFQFDGRNKFTQFTWRNFVPLCLQDINFVTGMLSMYHNYPNYPVYIIITIVILLTLSPLSPSGVLHVDGALHQ